MGLTRRLKGAVKRLVKNWARPLVRRYHAPRALLEPSHWDLTSDEGRGLCLEGLSLAALCDTWGSPLHVVNAPRLRRNLARFQQPLTRSALRCEVYYSYKTNPVAGLLRVLHEHGAGAEVISPYELWLALGLGVPPEKIVYNGPAKSDESIREAIAREILLININHREEIARVARIAASLGKRPAVGLRIGVPGGWGGQFGIPIANGQALRAYEQALAEEALDVVAVHAHFGLKLRSAEQLTAFVQSTLAFCDELHDKLGLELEIIDFGGSLGIPSVASITNAERRLNSAFRRPLSPPDVARALDIDGYVQRLLGEVESHFRARQRAVPRIFIEPGRALTGDTQMLVATVIDTQARDDGITFAILDAGINLAECVPHEFHQLFPVNRYGEPMAGTYTIAGPICSPGDVLYPAWELPALSPGDTLAIMDTGAYFVPSSTTFSFPRPAIVLVDEGRSVLLRRAETFDDLAALETGATPEPPPPLPDDRPLVATTP